MEVIPSRIVSSEELVRLVGKPVLCPLCRAQSTSDAEDIGWVAMPELKQEPRWLCLGSWIDVTSIARADDAARHPYYDDLKRLASLSGVSPDDMVELLRRRQVEILREKPTAESDGELNAMRQRLEDMVTSPR
jgi:hypothetical protein